LIERFGGRRVIPERRLHNREHRELAARVDALVERLAAHAPAAVQGMKRALNAIAAGMADEAAIARAWRESMRSADVAEGLAAHAEKRKPKFSDQ